MLFCDCYLYAKELLELAGKFAVCVGEMSSFTKVRVLSFDDARREQHLDSTLNLSSPG